MSYTADQVKHIKQPILIFLNVFFILHVETDFYFKISVEHLFGRN